MFTQDTIPKGLSFLKNIKNSVKQTSKTLSLKLYKKSFRGKGASLYCNVGADFLYLTERTHKPKDGGFAVLNSFNYKFSLKNGRLNIYEKKEVGNINKIRNVQMNFLLSPQYCRRFIPIFKMWLNQNGLDFKKSTSVQNPTHIYNNDLTYNIRRLCYPILETITDSRYEFLKHCAYNSDLTKYLRTHKVFRENQFLDYFFGYHGRHLKKLIYESVHDKRISFVFLLEKGRLIKKLVSPEAAIEFLGSDCLPNFNSWYNPKKYSREFLSYLSKDQRSYLVSRLKTSRDCHSLIDLSRRFHEDREAFNGIPKNRNFDVHQIENLILGGRNTRGYAYNFPDLSKPLRISDTWLLPDNGVCGNFQIKIPKDRQELLSWGNEMHNCVGAYGSYIDNGGVLYGIFLGEKIKYNISINSYGNLEQFYAACNMPPASEDYELIVRYLVSCGVAKSFPSL